MPLPSPHHRARLAALSAVFGDDELRDAFALDGGLVLQRVFGSPRDSNDVDLNHVEPYPHGAGPDARARLLRTIGRIRARLPLTGRAFGLLDATIEVERWSDRLATVYAWVVYRSEEDVRGRLELQATLCEPICRPVRARIDGVEVLAQSLEDVVAAKLKTLLQQADRGKVRHADVYDLWFGIEGASLVIRPEDVRPCLLDKMALWPELGPATAERFRQRSVVTFAEQGHRKLRAEQPDLEIPPFDAVWRRVLAFVDAMDLPAA